MTLDLLIGISTILACSLLAFLYIVASPKPNQRFLFSSVLFLTLGFVSFFAGKLAWARLIPSEYVIFAANLAPLLLSIAAGLSLRSSQIRLVIRPIAALMFLAVAMIHAVVPYCRPILYPVELSQQTVWSNDYCLQSHASSCAPAAAVTLLKLNGVTYSERELADWCLTSEKGTDSLGLYRGLARAVNSTAIKPQVAPVDPSEWVQSAAVPNISLVWLGKPTSVIPQIKFYGSKSFRIGFRGEGHAVVVLGRSKSGGWRILDPAFGETIWTDQQMQDRYTGESIYLAKQN